MNELTNLPKEQIQTLSMETFDHTQRVAKMLCSSDLVPKEFKGNIQNTIIALELASRIGASPLAVMQNLYIVHGKPSWSSTFIIAALNACGRFSPVRFEVTGEGENLACFAWCYENQTKEKIIGPTVTMKMAKAEGWIDKNGSKWKTMPELMIRYRAAAFFGRLYAPDIMMGMQTMEETIDIKPEVIDKEMERVELMIKEASTIEQLEKLKPHVKESQLELFNQRLNELR